MAWRMMLALLLALPALGGCQTKTGGAVGIVDLDEVAKQLKRDSAINADVQQAKTELEAKLKELQAQLQRQLEQKAKSLSDTGDERNQELTRLKQQLDSQFAQARQQAEANLAVRRQKLVNDFRDEVKPVAQRVAATRGSQLVVTKNDAVVFAFTPQADITLAVIDELRLRR